MSAVSPNTQREGRGGPRARRIYQRRRLRLFFGQAAQHLDAVEGNLLTEIRRLFEALMGAVASLRGEMLASFSGLKNTSISSFSPSSALLAAQTRAAPDGRENKKEEKNECVSDDDDSGWSTDEWVEVVDALKQYGITSATQTANEIQTTWMADDVHVLLAECWEMTTETGVHAWSPALVRHHLCNMDTGTSIDCDPCPEYVAAMQESEFLESVRREFESGRATPDGPLSRQQAKELSDDDFKSRFCRILPLLCDSRRTALARRTMTPEDFEIYKSYPSHPNAPDSS